MREHQLVAAHREALEVAGKPQSRLRPRVRNEHTLRNAVARLVLSSVQERLPQWAVRYADGSVHLVRACMPRRRAETPLLPRFLFTIDWADSGPGLSWPEAYWLSWLPGFDRHAVTASQDSSDLFGYTDVAIGHFPDDEDVMAGARRAILAWWRAQAKESEQQRWKALIHPGSVDERTASIWADKVWDPIGEGD